MKTENILFETKCERFWVADCGDGFTVFRSGITHSVSDSTYWKTEAGLSVAIARAIYLSKGKP